MSNRLAICPKRRQLGCRATAQSHCRLCKPYRRADHLVGAGEQAIRHGSQMQPKERQSRGQARLQKTVAVLIVEDDAELREFVARLLEDGELDTIECESAEAALATMLIRGRDIAMIFADIRLPGVMDGSTWRARSGCAGPFFL